MAELKNAMTAWAKAKRLGDTQGMVESGDALAELLACVSAKVLSACASDNMGQTGTALEFIREAWELRK